MNSDISAEKPPLDRDDGTSVKDTSILSVRAAASRLLAYTLFGLLAGVVLWLIETIDRLLVLRGSINGTGETLQLALLFGVAIAGSGIVGLGLGVAATALELVRQLLALAVSRLRGGLPPMMLEAASLIAAGIVVTIVLKTISGQFPGLLEVSIDRLVLRINDRLTPMPFVVEHWKAIYTLVIFLFTLAIMWSQVWLFRPRGRWSWLLAAAVVAGGGVALAVCYAFDSRAFYARYEYTIHWPLVIGYSVMTVLLMGFASRVVSSMDWGRELRRPIVATTVALAVLATGTIAYAATAMDSNQNVKALFWNRSVIARRTLEIARKLIDRDADGYSPSFGGGDTDDRNAAVHPFAAEIPGNGIDDNGIGGDLALEDMSAQWKVPAAGEFVPAAEPPVFSPKDAPQGAVDVMSPEAGTRPASGPVVKRPNVILLTIDCLRADHMSLYGYHRETTPNIDRYAANALTFTYAVPHGTNTGHSFCAMLRSSMMEGIFDRNVPTLTQELKGAGYATAFINARRFDDWLPPRRWHRYRPTMVENFDVLHLDGEREWTAEQLTDATIHYLDVLPAERPHFLWMHFMDVHMPREGHPEYGYGNTDIDVYDAEIRYVDAQLGRLLDRMRDHGMLENAIVIISADHGEGFLEHGTKDHSNKPYADNSHVPLIVMTPDAPKRRVDTVVGLFDVAPTVLTHVGLAVPDVYRGIDLLAAARQPVFPVRPIISETPRNGIETSFFAWAYIDWPYKYVYDIRGGTQELYDLAQDPDEQRSLIEIDRERATGMRNAFGRWLDLEMAPPPRPRAIP